MQPHLEGLKKVTTWLRFIPPLLAIKMLESASTLAIDKRINLMLAVDSRGARDRVSNHYELAKTADYVIFVIGCDDARSDVPTGLHIINGKKVVFQYIPVIGAGAPEEDTIDSILGEYVKRGVDPKKFMIINAQHGSHDEIAYAKEHDCSPDGELTCGARQNRGNDHLPIFLQRHLERNLGSRDIIENRDWAVNAIRGRLKTEYDHVPVFASMMDHNNKVIYFKETHPVFGEQLVLPAIKTWQHKIQDPRVAALAIGPQSSAVPNGDILPRYVIGRGYNNDFNAATKGDNRDDIITRLSEIWYATEHSLHAKQKGAGNFHDLEALTVIADSVAEMHRVQHLLLLPEVKTMMKPGLDRLGGVRYVVWANKDTQYPDVYHWKYPREDRMRV